MPFKEDLNKVYRKPPKIDLAIVSQKEGIPSKIWAVLEVKHYDYHENSKGLRGDFDKMITAKKGIYYRYAPSIKLKAYKGYLLYIVDEGDIKLSEELEGKKRLLQSDGFFSFLTGIGKTGDFLVEKVFL